MNHLTPGRAVLLLALAGCSDSSLVGADATTLDAPALTVAAKNEVKMVPLKGTWDLALDPTGTPVPCFAPGIPAPVAFLPSNKSLATGNVTHPGKTTSVITVDACTVNADGSLLGPGTLWQ